MAAARSNGGWRVRFSRLRARAGTMLLAVLAIGVLSPVVASLLIWSYREVTGVAPGDWESMVLLSVTVGMTGLVFSQGRSGAALPTQELASMGFKSGESTIGSNPEVARHEAAHLVAALHFEEPVSSASILSLGDTRGRVSLPSWSTRETTPEDFEQSRQRLWGNAVILLAGNLADGLAGIQSFGARDDLARFQELVPAIMACHYGGKGEPLSATEIHGRALAHARAILLANGDALDLAEDLLRRRGILHSYDPDAPLEAIGKLLVRVPDPAL